MRTAAYIFIALFCVASGLTFIALWGAMLAASRASRNLAGSETVRFIHVCPLSHRVNLVPDAARHSLIRWLSISPQFSLPGQRGGKQEYWVTPTSTEGREQITANTQTTTCKQH